MQTAQAQYRLKLCMLQRGDRGGAAKEVETMARTFSGPAGSCLRAKVEADPHEPRFIQTIRDIGYRFETGAE